MDRLGVPPDGVTVLVIGALCAALAALLRRRFGPAPRLGAALLCLGLVLTVGAAIVAPFAMKASPGPLGSAPVPLKLLFGLGVFLPSLWITGRMTGLAAAAHFDEFLHRVNAEHRHSMDYGKARARERGGDVEGALREYRKYFQDHPSIPEPLFSAAQLLAHRRRFSEAEAVLREICARFRKDPAVWTEATYRLANLLDADIGDKPAATALFREIIRVAGKSEQARLAAERLLRGFSNPPSAD
ncbi:MAG: hypothetical protein HZB26_09765 [Candidatus Hydrogenedentes bacterium]|nr:hypothetical protein [Candidatus Hydrogenedentota bacterium]